MFCSSISSIAPTPTINLVAVSSIVKSATITLHSENNFVVLKRLVSIFWVSKISTWQEIFRKSQPSMVLPLSGGGNFPLEEHTTIIASSDNYRGLSGRVIFCLNRAHDIMMFTEASHFNMLQPVPYLLAAA